MVRNRTICWEDFWKSVSCSARRLALAPLFSCAKHGDGGDLRGTRPAGRPHACKIKIDPTTQGVET